jgi:hypothetical protein
MSMTGDSRRVLVEPLKLPTTREEEPAPRREPEQPKASIKT